MQLPRLSRDSQRETDAVHSRKSLTPFALNQRGPAQRFLLCEKTAHLRPYLCYFIANIAETPAYNSRCDLISSTSAPQPAPHILVHLGTLLDSKSVGESCGSVFAILGSS